jgi:serine/threonine protein phosphatase 1
MRKGRRYVIGDIHGCFRTFKYLVEEELHMKPGDTLFLLGDTIDRGTGSKEVIDYIRELAAIMTVKPIMGNHEYMMLRSLEDEDYFHIWTLNGCAKTLISFGVSRFMANKRESVFQIPNEYIDFIQTWPLYEETEDFIFVHAGLDPHAKDPLSDIHSLLYRREEDYPEDIVGERRLIHGHTPVPLSSIIERLKTPGVKVLNLDGGCVYTNYPGLGVLVALDLDQMTLYSARNID